MVVRWLVLAVWMLGLMLPLAGCKPRRAAIDYSRELEPGRLALEKISPGEHPPFTLGQTRGAELARAAEWSLDYLSKPSSRQFFPYLDITHDRAVATVRAMQAMARRHAVSPIPDAELQERIRREFDVYRSIGGWDPSTRDFTRQVLFTGYFTPIYEASLTRQGEFQWPLYRRPTDLLTDPKGLTASRRTADGQFVLYHRRDEIERNNLLAGYELVFLPSRWQAYVISVQGSAKLRLRDGRIMEVGYAGNNGWPYISPGRRMVREGVITREQLSLRGLAAHFEAVPADMDRFLHVNPRFVFFAERPGGPFGSLNTPVTPWATVATDKQVYPRAMPTFVMTTVDGGASTFNAWMMDQDTGGAIRAAGRADLYMGIGPAAEAMAGRQLHEGRFYYIAIKPEFMARYLTAGPMAAGPTPGQRADAAATGR